MTPGLRAVEGAAAFFFLALWALLGWKDYHRQKISNRHLRVSGAIVLSWYAVLLAITLMGLQRWLAVYPYWGFYSAAALNVFLCAAAALALWWFGIWPAGDAKLFVLLGALYPLTDLRTMGDPRRLFLSALINTFIPASLSVFFQAGRYVFATRLTHRRHFLIQLGWVKEAHFLWDNLREAAGRIGGVRDAIGRFAAETRSRPMELAKNCVDWIARMLTMAVLSNLLKGILQSPVRMTLFWGVIFLIWSRVTAVIGDKISRWILPLLAVALILLRPPEQGIELARIFVNLSLFNFFLSAGIGATMTLLTGSAGAAYLVSFLFSILAAAAGALLPILAAYLGGRAPASLRSLELLAGMGIFFGLSLVLVRLWDREVHPSAVGEIGPYVVLAPGFVERLREDTAFYERYFSRLYADGLTQVQAKALERWCRKNHVETVPITPTISFAGWIFLGFFLARAWAGRDVIAMSIGSF